MKIKKTFSNILKNDKRVRFLFGGMVIDGLMAISLITLAVVMLAL